jgi:hypothetical protein
LAGGAGVRVQGIRYEISETKEGVTCLLFVLSLSAFNTIRKKIPYPLEELDIDHCRLESLDE